MKKILSYIIIFFVSFLILTSLFKLIKNLSLFQEKKTTFSFGSNKNIENVHRQSKWVQNDYFLPNHAWQYFKLNDEIKVGKKYYLIQKIFDNKMCFFGVFYLKKLHNEFIVLKSEQKYKVSKIEQYAKIKSIRMITLLASENDAVSLRQLENCKDWTYIENL
ncbi:hypothetical protein [Silvanigrella aquatica]|uniref:Uncharacterized protein n=1 Tax=Silvanigrella aquatica TaxID=1915309 RepID=A0A1L4CX28_9BACT|nr:hypothetical protein [Silvanigrella aquatica]APJ02505.1 hypothetical protein AXG55_00575 [Silvanigrella aquatica]